MAKHRTHETHHSARRVLAGDPWVAVLDEALAGLKGKIPASGVWNIIGKCDPCERTQDDNFRLGEAMRALGWTRTMQRFGYGTSPKSAYMKGARLERRVQIFVFWDPITGEILVTQSTDPIRDDIRPVGWKNPYGF
jgi:hypothetical protein